MEFSKAYYDLCVSVKDLSKQTFAAMRKKYVELGYRTIAVNLMHMENVTEAPKKKKKGEARDLGDVPLPYYNKKQEESDKLKILNRITIAFSDATFLHKAMKSENIKKYDILALLPTSQTALQYVSTSGEGDILSFDPQQQSEVRFNRKIYNSIQARGMHFEIMYAPAIVDSSLRKNIISKSHMYHSYGKSKNIIVSSWAFNEMMIRSPYDVINLGLIFGLTEEQCKAAVHNACKNVIIHAVGRKIGKGIMFIGNLQAADPVETMVIGDSDEEDEAEPADQPAQKRSKQ